MHIFDTATALTELDQGHLTGQTSTDYGNLVGPFGGILAANLMRAVLEDSRATGDPISITVNFCAAVSDGAFDITTKLVRAGKYVQHWSLELAQGEKICSTASIILAKRQVDFSHQTMDAPQITPPQDCPPLPEVASFSNWLNRYEFRFAEGPPPTGAQPADALASPRSALWIADKPDRPLDYLSLTALSDSFLLRLFHVRGTLVPMGTVSLTTHFIGTTAELAEQGTEPLLGIADAIRFHGNFHDQSMQLWSTSGKLLATGTQIVWFKE